jgi:hypothetical protein
MTVVMESYVSEWYETRPRPQARSAAGGGWRRELAGGGPGSGTLAAKGELSGYGASDQ